jgi:hypothetical protein
LISVGDSSARVWKVLNASSSFDTSFEERESNCVDAALRSLQYSLSGPSSPPPQPASVTAATRATDARASGVFMESP